MPLKFQDDKRHYSLDSSCLSSSITDIQKITATRRRFLKQKCCNFSEMCRSLYSISWNQCWVVNYILWPVGPEQNGCIDIPNGPWWSHRQDPKPILLLVQFPLDGSENGKIFHFTIRFYSCLATIWEPFTMQVSGRIFEDRGWIYMKDYVVMHEDMDFHRCILALWKVWLLLFLQKDAVLYTNYLEISINFCLRNVHDNIWEHYIILN